MQIKSKHSILTEIRFLNLLKIISDGSGSRRFGNSKEIRINWRRISGNSKNLINAVKIAKKKKVKTISFTGFDGGKLSKLSDFNINFPMANYGIVEDCHVTMMHYISQYLRNTAIKSRNFKKINF